MASVKQDPRDARLDGLLNEGLDEDDAGLDVSVLKNARQDNMAEEVDPGTSTMGSLATMKDVYGGRTSANYGNVKRRMEEERQDKKMRKRKQMQNLRAKEAELRRLLEEQRARGEEVPVLSVQMVKATAERMLEARARRRRERGLDADFSEEGEASSEEESSVPLALLGAAGGSPSVKEEHERAEDSGDAGRSGAAHAPSAAAQITFENGQIRIDTSSLQVDDPSRVDPQRLRDTYENANERMVNSATYSRHTHGRKWSAEETQLFYECLSMCGTDFGMISQMFPTRSRAQIRNKWNKEERQSPHRVTAALKSRKPLDLRKFSYVSGVDLSRPAPEDPMQRVQQLIAESERDESALQALHDQSVQAVGLAAKRGRGRGRR